ncbi:MAG: acetyl-CoA carboxylase biotin carboxyl carrier protein [Xanthobacteraceae bacterium]
MAAKAKTPSAKPTDERELIRDLAALLDSTNLTEIEVEREGLRVRVVRSVTVAAAPQSVAYAAPAGTAATAAAPAASDLSKHPGMVPSPMVGTAYIASEPGARPFVDIGARVEAGQTLLIIEAMKTMNQIPAPRSGTVTQILFEDGQPVEFGEPLMIIE